MTTLPMVAPICFQVAINGDPTKPCVYSGAFPVGKNRAIIPMHDPIVGSSFMTTFPMAAPVCFQVAINGDPTKSYIQPMNHVHKLMYAAVNFPQAT